MEIVRRNPTVILDGAHNPDKMRAMVKSIQDIWKGKKITAIAAIKEDKNAKEMLEILLPICWKIILTQYKVKMDQGEILSYPPKTLSLLLNQIDSRNRYEIIISPQYSLQQAINNADRKDIILVTGSLYLVGEIKKTYDA